MPLKCVLLAVALALVGPSAARGAEPEKAPAATGRLQLTFTERSPLSTLEQVCRPAEFDPKEHFPPEKKDRWEYDLAKESFEVVVPRGYRPGAPYGLFVFISPGEAQAPRAWLEVLARHKLIWVSANNAGTSRGIPIRMGLALDAAHNMKKRYNLDPARIYVGGYSNGGQLASYVIRGFSQEFSGAYCMLGYSFYGGRLNDKGQVEPGVSSWAWHGPIDRIKKDVKLVLMDGEGDPQCRPGAARASSEAFLLDGFQRVNFIEVPRLGHRPPDRAWFEKGLLALEAKPKTPPTTRPTRDPNPGPGQVAQARRMVVTALEHIDGAAKNGRPPGQGSRRLLERVVEEYPTTPAAAQARDLLAQHYPRAPG